MARHARGVSERKGSEGKQEEERYEENTRGKCAAGV